MTTEKLLNAKTVEPFGVTTLVRRAHKEYHGPIYTAEGKFWIFYQNVPLEVVCMNTNDGHYHEADDATKLANAKDVSIQRLD